MPGLVLGGRRWGLSSDDLPFPVMLESVIRFAWLVMLSVTVWRLPQLDSTCSPMTRLLLTYLIGLQLLQIMILVVNGALINLGLQGTILWDAPRAGMTPLVYFRAFLFVPEVGWHALGAVWSWIVHSNAEAASDELDGSQVEPTILLPCRQLNDMQVTVTLMLWLGVAMAVSLLLGVMIVFDPAGSLKHFSPNANHIASDEEVGRLFVKPTQKGHRLLSRRWRARLRIFFCCVWFDTGSSEAYRDVSELFSDWFHDIDVVPSDLMCALILLRKKQSKLRKLTGSTSIMTNEEHRLKPFVKLSPSIVTLQQQVLSASVPPHGWMTPENAFHYMRFAWGSYGWPAFMLTHAFTGLCTLWSGLRCCACVRPMRPPRATSQTAAAPTTTTAPTETATESAPPASSMLKLRGDNCCECHTATVRNLARIPDKDLLMVSFKNSLYKIPFFVCYDHERMSVVIVVRGTLSINDILTDFTGDSADIDGWGVPQGSLCHKGLLKCARYIISQLGEHRVLETAFEAYPSYRLVLTGHSLGGGVCATIGILLRDKYPTLRCFIYSPPGGTFSRELCRLTESFALSVVVGDDVVPRLGLVQFEEFKRQLLTCLIENDRPKHDILMRGLGALLCTLCRRGKKSGRMTGVVGGSGAAIPHHHHESAKDELWLERQQAMKQKIFNKLNSHLAATVSVSTGVTLNNGHPQQQQQHKEKKLPTMLQPKKSEDHPADAPPGSPPSEPTRAATTTTTPTASPPKLPPEVTAESVVRSAMAKLTEQKLFPPGKILYLTEAINGFEAWWAPPEHFDHVIISPHMLTDHLPDASYKVLKSICQQNAERL